VKYLVMQVTGPGDLVREFPVIFPDAIVHKDMAEAMRRLPDMRLSKPVAAGFVSSCHVGPGFHGESESLGLESRERADDELVSMLDYTHGLVF